MEKRYKKEVEKLGKTIRMIRLSKGITQLDLELLSNINRTEISRIENGQKNVEFLTLVRLATSLDIQLSELFK